MEPRYLREYAQELVAIGPAAFAHRYRGAVLLGLAMSGGVSERAPNPRRRTLGAVPLAELDEARAVHERVWRIRKDPSAPPGPYITLGRVGENDIVVPEYTISSHHCAFGFESFRMTVADLGSLNGTTLQGERLPRRVSVPLRDGVALGFGRLRCRLLERDSFLREVVRVARALAA